MHCKPEPSCSSLIEIAENLVLSAIDILHFMVKVHIHQSPNKLRLDNLHSLLPRHIREEQSLLFLALLEFGSDLGPPLLVQLPLPGHDVVYLIPTIQEICYSII